MSETDRKDLREKLTPEQYAVTQEGATERPFTGKYYYHDASGAYRCIVCGNELFRSDAKYDSGSGWPSFFQPTENAAVETREDRTHGMTRTEILCAQCGAHLGHVFPDGPRPTGLRYCVNSAALDFEGSE